MPFYPNWEEFHYIIHGSQFAFYNIFYFLNIIFQAVNNAFSPSS